MQGLQTQTRLVLCLFISVRVDLSIHLLLPVFVYKSVEGHAILPAGGEVCYVHVGISAMTGQRDIAEEELLH